MTDKTNDKQATVQTVVVDPVTIPDDTWVTVRVIERQDQASLVEWLTEEGSHARAVVPAKEVKGDVIKASTLKKGVPHGLDWERLIKITVKPADVARSMRRRGLFTIADIDAGGPAIFAAFAEAFGTDLAHLIENAREETEKGEQA